MYQTELCVSLVKKSMLIKTENKKETHEVQALISESNNIGENEELLIF